MRQEEEGGVVRVRAFLTTIANFHRINKSLAPTCQQSNFIGILDIFGFEIFQQNR